MGEVRETICQVLDGFCENHVDLFPAVELLKACYEQLPPASQTNFFKVLAERLQSEPIRPPNSPNFGRSSHILIIRAWAAFGPVDALPKLLFSLLSQNTREAMESWAFMIGQELLMSLGSYKTRFSEAALVEVKGQCASITCDQSDGLNDSRLPPVLVEVLEHLENLVKKIEFDRNVVQKLRPQPNATRSKASRRDDTQEVAMGRASQKFDRQLFTLKLSELAYQMQMKGVASDTKAGAVYRETGGSFLVNMVDGQMVLLREWLEGVDQICREVWQIQGETITPDFVREILLPEAMMLIGARESTVKSNVTDVTQRTRIEDPYRALSHFAMEMRRLTGEVTNRYEIEARELEYQRAPTAPEGGKPKTGTDVGRQPVKATILNVLIASPSDVNTERDAVESAIREWNANHHAQTGIMLHAVRWETHSYPAAGDRPQGIINRQIVDSGHLLIGIFGNRLGTPTGEAQSGTIEEIERFRKTGRHVALYFSNAPVPRSADRNQLEALEKYQKERQQDTLYSTFDTADDLRRLVTQHLPKIVSDVYQGVPARADAAKQIPSLVFIFGVPLGDNDSASWMMMLRHYGPKPAYNCNIEFYDSDRKNIEHQWLVEHPSSPFPPRGLAAGESQKSVYIAETNPEGSAGSFIWNPLDPNRQHYTVSISCRDGVFVEKWEVTRVDGILRSAITIERGPQWVEKNPHVDPVVFRCSDPEFISTPLAAEVPKVARKAVHPGWKPNHRFEVPAAIIDPNGNIQVVAGVKLPDGSTVTDFGCWNILTKHFGDGTS